MEKQLVSRRRFIGASATASAVAVSSAAGIKPRDLPDLTIKDVKVYVVKDYSHVVSVTTTSGIEGNFTFRNTGSDLVVPNWLEALKPMLAGKSALDRASLSSQWAPQLRRNGGIPLGSGAVDCCLWDILGKAVELPIYQLLGACRTRLMAYASSQMLTSPEEFVASALKAKAEGFKCYKVHAPVIPPFESASVYVRGTPPDRGGDYRLDMEVARAVRKAVGDDYLLMWDRVGVYNRQEALTVGRLLDELKYMAYEDPIPTSDLEGWAELASRLDIPLHMGEMLNSIYDYAEYIRRGAAGVVRVVIDYGITGAMKIAHLAECFGMDCAPHNWGDTFEQAGCFQCELAMPNSFMFEVPYPQGFLDAPYMKDRCRITKDGDVEAPTKPGLGYEIDRNVLDNMTIKVAR